MNDKFYRTGSLPPSGQVKPTTKFKKMLEDILHFLNINYDSNLINLDIKANSASVPKSILFQKLLYKNYFLKNVLKKIIPSKYIFPLKSRLIRFNKSRISSSEINVLLDDFLNEKYINWNNKVVLETEKITGLSLSDWKY